MAVRHDYPHAVDVLDGVFIPMPDGCQLAARIWLPKDALKNPVPAILEYIPYRQRDHYRQFDQLTHPYFAGHGYACLRVDLRGAGDSDGLLLDEYLEQEQQDALDLLAWIATQEWCNGSVGMIGLSWGGFNGLQVAARRPPQLKAVVTIGSSDDRYSDDVHYMGGCMVTRNLGWAAYMQVFGSQPPDPAIVGARWREMWLERLEKGASWQTPWFQHQHRDDYWRFGSVCESYDAIECAVYAVGGWADAYTNTVLRLLANLKSPCKGLIGPWGHDYPHVAGPGPAIGWLQETLRWWDRWLRGIDNGIMEEPRLKVWMQASERPAVQYYDDRTGHWASEPVWPSPSIRPQSWRIDNGCLRRMQSAPVSGGTALVSSPENVGIASGAWCSYGYGPDLPGDQRADDAGSVCFDSEPLADDVAFLGTPLLRLRLSSSRPLGMLAVRLNDVFEDGSSARVSYGLLNLAHRNGDDMPVAMEPSEAYEFTVRLKDAGHVFRPGNRIRIAISTIYWPTIWPSPERVEVTVPTPTIELILPERKARAEDKDVSFELAESSPPLGVQHLRASGPVSTVEHDVVTDTWRQHKGRTSSLRIAEIDTTETVDWHETMSIRRGDPTSARHEINYSICLSRGSWQPRVELAVIMTSTTEQFLIDNRLSAYEEQTRIFSRAWTEAFDRDHI